MPNLPPSPLIRLNKLIADSGYCARRKADELITAGRVTVNGKTVTVLGTKINPREDQVAVDGRALPKTARFHLAFHKPVGTVTSRRAGKQQKSIYALIPPEYQAADPAGRLDQDSSGLIILSNDGDFIQQITHPRYHLEKIYQVTTDKALSPEAMQRLKAGVPLMPENKQAQMIRIQPTPGLKKTYQMTLITGYNRQIRRSLEAVGYRVQALTRLSFGPIRLGSLEPGKLRPLTQTELKQLRQSAAGAAPPQQGQDSPQDEHRKAQHHRQHKGQGQTEGQRHKKRPPARGGT